VPESGVGDVCPVHQIGVVLPIPTGSRTDTTSVLADARDHLEHPPIGALERQSVENLGREVEADFARSSVDDRRGGDDRQLLFDFEADNEVDLRVLADSDDGGPLGVAETGFVDEDFVLAGGRYSN
jgi:hypothetical protein